MDWFEESLYYSWLFPEHTWSVTSWHLWVAIGVISAVLEVRAQGQSSKAHGQPSALFFVGPAAAHLDQMVKTNLCFSFSF